jgi:hypothetical protein
MATSAPAAKRRTFLDWLGRIGYWALAAPFALAAATFGLFMPAASAVWVAEWTFSTGILALEVAVVTILMIVTSAGVWFAFSRPQVAKRLRLGRFEPAVWALLVAFFAVASFAALTSLLYLEGAIAISEPVDRELLIDKTSEVYVWHLFDTVPLLDIPQNLEWQVPFEFEDRIGGLLLILFTGIVILPLIQVVRLIATGSRNPYEDSVVRALGTNARKADVRRLAGRHGSERAVIEGEARILVDVMQDVSSEDYPLRRLDFALGYQDWRPGGGGARGVDGYLLVVDAVGERARDRIEEAFGRSAFPAVLAVWRSDQPRGHLGEAVDRLAAAIEAGRSEPDGQPPS